MCGIVGYIGEREAVPLILEGLGNLAYRGYDSAGVVVRNGGSLESVKAEGKLSQLVAKLAERLQRERPHLRVLFVSGYHDDESFEDGTPVVGAAFLPKPFTPRSLVAKVREMLEGQVQESAR